LQDSRNVLQFLDIPLLQHQESIIILVSDSFQRLHPGKHLHHSRLEGLVLLIDLPELLLPVVLDDVVDVDLRSLEEGLGLVGVGVHAHLHLLALQLHLLHLRVFHLLLLCSHWVGGLAGVFRSAQLCVLLSAHLLEEVLLVGLVLGLLDAVELSLSFEGLFFEDAFGL
jgi:hypothetical protein